MSQVQIRCPSCQSALAVNYPWAAGAAVLCPRCQNQIDLPDSRRFAASAEESVDPFANSGGVPAAARPVRRPQMQPASARDARYYEAPEAVVSSKLLLFLAI